MQKAFEERNDIIEDHVSIANPEAIYQAQVKVGQKITLVHERRVGYFPDSSEWQLSHLSLELIDAKTHQIIAKDDNKMDTVHQVANCIKQQNSKECSSKTRTFEALIKVKLVDAKIDGVAQEPFALLLSNRIKK